MSVERQILVLQGAPIPAGLPDRIWTFLCVSFLTLLHAGSASAQDQSTFRDDRRPQYVEGAVPGLPDAPIRFRHLSQKDGLSSDGVYAIFQDSLGFIWFGTEDGLNRYDGTRVRVFRPEPFDSTAITSTWALRLVDDSAGGFWVATSNGGINRYHPETETFSYARSGDGGALPSDDLFDLLRSQDGKLWVGTRYDGLFSFDPGTESVTRFGDQADSMAGAHIQAIVEDRNNRIWVGTRTLGLVVLDPSTGKFTRIGDPKSDTHPLQHASVLALLVDTAGAIWIGTADMGLFRYRPESQELTRFNHDPKNLGSLGDDEVLSLLQDPAGMIWIGTRTGLDRFDTESGNFAHFRHDPSDETSIQPGPVLSMLLDRSGLFWIGTSRGAGLFDWRTRQFALLEHSPDEPNSIEGSSIQSIYEDREGILWVGTHTGLNRIDRKTGEVTRFRPDPANSKGLANGQIMLLYEDRAGNFWVGARRGALHLFDRTTGTVLKRFGGTGSAGGLSNDTPWFMYEDHEGQLWITSGGRGCLSRMNPADQTFTSFCHNADDPNTPSYDIAHDLIETSDGKLWLATWGGGLDRFDPQTGVFDHFVHDQSDEKTIADDFVLSMYKDRDDVLWLGTFGAGLDRYNTHTGEITHYSTSNSDLPNNVVLAIEGDDAGDIWLSTYQGISRFSPESERFRNYGAEDGLQSQEFTNNAKFRSSDGTMYFGGEKGLNAFQPSRMADRELSPNVVFTEIRIRGESAAITADNGMRQAIPATRSVSLSHDQRDITVSFAGMDYLSPSRTRYRYKLTGYDNSWQKVVGIPAATYTKLDPGEYVLQVQAANSQGVWSDRVASLGISIRPPWWRTIWATLLFIVGATALLFAAIRYYRNKLKLERRLEFEVLEAENLRELDRTRSRFFANVSHEFRTPLTLTLGPLDDLSAGLHGELSEDMAEQVDLARRNAGRVLDLINQILEVSRIEAGRTPLRAQRLDLAAFLRNVARSFAPLAARKKQSFAVTVPDDCVAVYADPQLLEKIVANMLSNAVKFTPEGGSVAVELRVDEAKAQILVHDSGPGIPSDELPYIFDRFYRASESTTWKQLGTGIGLALARELAELHHAELTVESTAGVGSVFILALKLGREHLKDAELVDDTEPMSVASTPPPNAPALVATASHYSSEGDECADKQVSTASGLSTEPCADDASAEANGSTERKTLLIVDDNPEIRAYVRRHLQTKYSVIEAPDGVEGLSMAASLLPDLIVSDVMMPRMDGFAFCRAIKSDPETDFIPLVLLTAKAEHEDKLEGLQERADDYLTKPFQIDELLARIDNLIESRRRLRERYSISSSPSSTAPAVAAANVSSADAVFLDRIRTIVDEHLDDETFRVEQLADAVGIDRSQLYRRLQDLLGESPTDLIINARLERAAALLSANAGNVSEVAYAVGFKTLAHFSRRFRHKYDCTPSAFRANGTESTTSSARS